MLGAVLSSEAGLAAESENSRCAPVISADFAVLSGVKVGFLIGPHWHSLLRNWSQRGPGDL